MTTGDHSVKRLPASRIECTVSFGSEETKNAETRALANLAQDVKLKGFRPGKAPEELLREHIDENRLLEETVRNLIPETLQMLIEKESLHPIAHPKVEVMSRTPLTLKVTIVEKPAVKVKRPDSIKIEHKKPAVDEKDIDRMVEYVLRQHRKTVQVERAAKENDQVIMDFWAQDSEGNEIHGIREKSYAAVIGSKTLLPGFEDALIGLEAGKGKTFTLTFPEKYHAQELQGKKATFHVTVQAVEAVQQPALTDDFAKQHLEADSANAFRERIRRSMEQQEQNIERKRREEQLFEAIREATVVELAPELVEEEKGAIIEQMEQQLQRQGKKFQDWLQAQKKTPEEVQKDLQIQAEKRLRLRLGIEQLIEDKDIRIPEEEMERNITALLAPLSEEQRTQLREQYQQGKPAYAQLAWQKKVEKLIESFLA